MVSTPSSHTFPLTVQWVLMISITSMPFLSYLPCYLSDFSTSISVRNLPVTIFHRLFRVHQWANRLKAVLLDLPLVRHWVPLAGYGHSVPWCSQFSLFCFRKNCFFKRRELSAHSPTPNQEEQGITLCLAPTFRPVLHRWPYQDYKTPTDIALGWGSLEQASHLTTNKLVIPIKMGNILSIAFLRLLWSNTKVTSWWYIEQPGASQDSNLPRNIL